MMRDKISEIETIRSRKLPEGRPLVDLIDNLLHSWMMPGHRNQFDADFTIVRIVTILEVSFKDWTSRLIDFGEPYIENASQMNQSKNIKLDFGLIRAIHGKRVTIGELLSHSLSCNGIADIDRSISDITGNNLFISIESVVDRVQHEIFNKPSQPIIKDITTNRSALSRLFEIRHIIVHELPNESIYQIDEVEAMIRHVKDFIQAVTEYILSLLYGEYPITQTDMNIEASKEARDVDKKLAEILATIDPKNKDKDLWKTQRAWERYRKFQCEYRSGINKPFPGSIAPTLYGLESASLTRERIALMNWYVERKEGEM